jgi:lysophospholipase L1-like esterase
MKKLIPEILLNLGWFIIWTVIWSLLFYPTNAQIPIPLKLPSQYAVQFDGTSQPWSNSNPTNLGLNGDASIHKVYCLGNSLTFAGTYETQLSSLLGTGWIVINKGVGGNTTSDMLIRVYTDVLNNSDASYVIVFGGINDLVGHNWALNAESNLASIYADIHNAGAKVIAVTITPCKACTSWTSTLQSSMDSVNAWIKALPVNVDFAIDAFTALQDSRPNYLLPANSGTDSLHLSTVGYQLLGTTIYNNVSWIGSASEMIGFIDDRTFENSKGNWTDNGNHTAVRSTTYKKAGNASLKITATAAGDNTTNFESLPASAYTLTVNGNKYTLETYAYGNTNGVTLAINVGDQTITGKVVYNAIEGTFTKLVFNYPATSSTVNQPIKLYLSGAGDCYIDQNSMSQAWDAMLFAMIKFPLSGATNAGIFGIGESASGVANTWQLGKYSTYTNYIQIISSTVAGAFILNFHQSTSLTGWMPVVILLQRDGNATIYISKTTITNSASMVLQGAISPTGLYIGSSSGGVFLSSSVGEMQFTRFTSLPSTISTIVSQILLTKKPLSNYPNGTIVFWTDCKTPTDKSGNGNNLTGNGTILKVKY